MDFLKKNYEKILLGVVLVGLVGALIFMPFFIRSDKDATTTVIEGQVNPSVKPLTNLDLTASDLAINRQKAAYSLDLDSSNKVFNPGEWQRDQAGNLIMAKYTGPQAVVVTNITPLYLILALDSVTTNEFGARYVISAERQAERVPAKRHKQQHYVSVGDKANEIFALVEAKGADPVNPDFLLLKLTDTGEMIKLSPGKPFQRVDGYSTDFKYDLEKKSFRSRRVGDNVSFGGADYLVAGINQNELILQDQSNQKKTSLLFAP